MGGGDKEEDSDVTDSENQRAHEEAGGRTVVVSPGIGRDGKDPFFGFSGSVDRAPIGLALLPEKTKERWGQQGKMAKSVEGEEGEVFPPLFGTSLCLLFLAFGVIGDLLNYFCFSFSRKRQFDFFNSLSFIQQYWKILTEFTRLVCSQNEDNDISVRQEAN